MYQGDLILENADPRYRDMIAGFVSDKRNWVIPAFGIRKKVIQLDVAATEQELQLRGDFVYCDINSTGVAQCKLNKPSEDDFPLVALSGVQDLPYEKIYLTYGAQAGLVLNLWYGYRSRFISPTTAIATIGSITNAVKIQDSNGQIIRSRSVTGAAPLSGDFALLTRDIGFLNGASFASTTALAANTPVNILAAVSNVNGAILWACGAAGVTAGLGNMAFLAKATAPATVIDGIVLALMMANAAGPAFQASSMGQARGLASGLRLDIIATIVQTSSFYHANYSTL